MGVTVPSRVATEAVGSYPTISPLPFRWLLKRNSAVCFLLPCPSLWVLRLMAPGC